MSRFVKKDIYAPKQLASYEEREAEIIRIEQFLLSTSGEVNVAYAYTLPTLYEKDDVIQIVTSFIYRNSDKNYKFFVEMIPSNVLIIKILNPLQLSQIPFTTTNRLITGGVIKIR